MNNLEELAVAASATPERPASQGSRHRPRYVWLYLFASVVTAVGALSVLLGLTMLIVVMCEAYGRRQLPDVLATLLPIYVIIAGSSLGLIGAIGLAVRDIARK